MKTVAIIMQISLTKDNTVLEFLPILVYSKAIPLRKSPCCLQQVGAAKFIHGITSFVPQARPAFHHLQYWYIKAWWGKQDYSFSTQCESESSLPMITAKKRSLRKYVISQLRHAFHM